MRGLSARNVEPVPQARSTIVTDGRSASAVDHRVDHRRVARAAIIGLAQCQPGGAEAHASASIAPAKSLADSSQVGSASPGGARARREPLPLLRILDQHPQRARQRLHVVRLDQHAGVGRHRVGNGAGRGADHRQAVRQRLGEGHAVAFEARRQHEQIGCRHRARRADPPAARPARRSGRRACGLRYRRRAAPPPPRRACGRRQSSAATAESASGASAAISTSIALARHDRADREQPHDAVAAALRRLAAIGAGTRHGDDLGRNVVVVDQQRARSKGW